MSPDPPSDLPLWLRAAVVAVLTIALVGNIVADIYVPGYQGQFVTIMLGGLVGTGIGLAKIYKGGGGP